MRILKNFNSFLTIACQLIIVSLLCVSYTSRYDIVSAQDTGFELPVQLIGFPVIILSVRTANFVRKLAYAINPSTYRRATRNAKTTDDSESKPNFAKADRELLNHLGPDYCIYEETCSHNAETAISGGSIDWTEIINNFTQLPVKKQQFYLLSVFLGNIIQSKELCKHFKETNKICPPLGDENESS